MGNKTYKDATIKIDNASGSITAITGQVNNVSLAGALAIIEQSALGSGRRSYLSGLAGATISLNGMVNSTTDGIFGPLVGNTTSITKTIEFYNGTKYYNGEVWPTSVKISGKVNDLQLWSADFTFSSAVNRTSVGLS